MINTSGIVDTNFSADHSSVEVTHTDGTVAVYTGEDLFAVCEEILSGKQKKVVTKGEDGEFHTEYVPRQPPVSLGLT
jgi:hypothetical protein